MTTAEWRVTRQTPEGNQLPPMDYTDKEQAVAHVDRAHQLGIGATLQQYNQFADQWQEYTP